MRSRIIDVLCAILGRIHSMHYSIDKTTIIQGMMRSGTTWLAEILHRVTGWPIIWEPLLLSNIPDLASKYGLNGRNYRHPDAEDPRITYLLRLLLSGAYLRRSLLAKMDINTAWSLLGGAPLIVKFRRASLLLPYLHAQFPRTKIILIIRNPYAVVASQLLHGAWEKVRVFEPRQPEFYTDYPEFVLDEVPLHQEEILAAYWALDHAYLERNLERLEGICIVRYEDLYRSPRDTLQKILNYMDIRWEDRYLEFVGVKSRTVRPGSALLENKDPTTKWMHFLDNAQKERIGRVLARFDYPFYGPDELFSSQFSPEP